jgi:hypothetical protein
MDYDKIRQLESQKGKDLSGLHGICVRKGMINEISYDPYNGTCFESEHEQRVIFDGWVRDHSYLGLDTMLCLWNTGKKVTNCKFAQDYKSL